MTAGNSFGTAFRFTSWGESHGSAIGVVIDGVPPRLPLDEATIQPYLDRRRPGQSAYTTQRQEDDKVRILSGVFEGLTTGAPLSLLIENTDARSKDYAEIQDKFRPGHADLTYQLKYGIRDYRGGGRSSARETACRVAAGAVARLILEQQTSPSVQIRGAVVQIGPHAIDRSRWDWDQVTENPFFCPDAGSVARWTDFLDATRKNGSSAGAIIEITAEGIPAGLGDPVYDKLDGDIARALMTINAVKGVEIGAGFAAAAMAGETAADEIEKTTEGRLHFRTNHAGGVLGGISTGQPVVARFAVKPTSSILTPRHTVTVGGENTTIETKGRHDPCVGIRAVPVGEAMLACVLADHLIRHRGQCA